MMDVWRILRQREREWERVRERERESVCEREREWEREKRSREKVCVETCMATLADSLLKHNLWQYCMFVGELCLFVYESGNNRFLLLQTYVVYSGQK